MSVIVWVRGITGSPMWASIAAGAFAALVGSGLTWYATNSNAKRQRVHEADLASVERAQERKLEAYCAILRYASSVVKYVDYHTQRLKTSEVEPVLQNVESEVEALSNLVVSPIVLDQLSVAMRKYPLVAN
jgi:hypothetical protein